MSARSRILLFLISTPVAALLVVGGLLGAARVAPQNGVPHLRVFEDVVQLVMHAYVEDVNLDRIFDGAMRGLSDGLDSSSAYLTPDEVRAAEANRPLPTGDVGLVLSRQFYLLIVGVRDGSPAKRAGLANGDFIRAIDDKPARDLSAYAGSRLLRGAPGSKVKLLVLRNNAAEPHTIELTREAVSGDSVTSRRLPGGELYMRVTSFTPETAGAIRAQLPAGSADALAAGRVTPNISASGGVSRAIIDLRDTADGTAEDGVAAARLFVTSGTLATRVERNKPNVTVTANAGDGAVTVPVVLLVSNGTANGAEVFAAAMAGNKRARLVGEPTAGIAALQRLVRLPEGHGLWLTYAQYMQNDGTAIHEHGLRPDVPVQIPSVGFDEKPATTDPVLDRAVEELKKSQAAAPAASPAPAR